MTAKILIVEDEAITAIDVKNTLESMDFEVVSVVFSGEEAIKKAEELKPDLIIMDIHLKGEIDGIEAAKKIMTFFDIPVIYLTAYSDKKTFQRAKLTEPYGFITKPFSPEGIVISIETALYKHQLDKKIKESEEKYHLLYQDAPLPYQSLNESGHIIEVNQAWLDTLGYSKEEVIGKWFGNFLNTNYTEKFMENFPKFKAKGEICNIEFEMKRKDGSTIIVEFNGKISYGEQGNFQRTHCIFQDVTKQKKVEEKNRRILGNIAESYVEFDNEWRFVDVNSKTEDIIGVKKDELIGKVVWDAFPQSIGSKQYKEYHRAKKENIPVRFETKSLLNNEWLELTAYPHPEGLTVYAHNITKRKKDEEKLKQAHEYLELKVQERTNELEKAYSSLKESEEKFRLIFDKAEDSIVLNEIMENGMPGKIIEANETTFKRLGYTKEELLNMSPQEIVIPEKLVEMQKIAGIIEKEGHAIYETIDISKDGLRTPVEVNSHIFEFKGKKTALIIARDITRRKEMEEQLKESITELERSNKELQSFAYITSHDLQEPLRTIGNYAGLLKHRYEGKLDEDADEFLEFMTSGAARMKDMVQGLLDYSRVGTHCKFTEFNSEKALKCALTNLQSAIKESHAKVTHKSLPLITANESQITRLFQNLIGNALKFRKEEAPKIHISCRKENNEYVFSVSDNGIGLEEQYSDRIFEVFKRLHAIGEYQGAGIGLAIAKRIIDCHNGRIWVKSKLGEGSTFYFTIPLNLVEIEK
ncbi:PAS domain S-box protein [Methanobacterium oryzae]|uniref:PAS domain S-box protein n=1 Tax=Methanobacterium oryzae TaxID=69540 RepID=UPI003D20EE6F